jgi:hypothetical protein
MGESESRTITVGWSSDPDSVPDPKAEARKKRELDALTLRTFGEAAPHVPTVQPKKRWHKPQTERLYTRFVEIPRTVPLEKAALMYDKAQRPFPVPKYLRDRGWPDSWVKAWNDKDGGFRKKLSDLRQCAWQWKSSK